ALGLHRQLPLEVALRDRGDDPGDAAHLVGQVGGHQVDRVAEVLPDPDHAGDLGLAAQIALGADFAGHARDLAGERVQLVDHHVDGVFELEDLPPALDGDLLAEVALGHGRGDLGDVADLAGQVAGHRVDVVGQVLPGAGDIGHLGLAAELAL